MCVYERVVLGHPSISKGISVSRCAPIRPTDDGDWIVKRLPKNHTSDSEIVNTIRAGPQEEVIGHLEGFNDDKYCATISNRWVAVSSDDGVVEVWMQVDEVPGTAICR